MKYTDPDDHDPAGDCEDARDDARPAALLARDAEGAWRCLAVGPVWACIDLALTVEFATRVVTLESEIVVFSWTPGTLQ